MSLLKRTESAQQSQSKQPQTPPPLPGRAANSRPNPFGRSSSSSRSSGSGSSRFGSGSPFSRQEKLVNTVLPLSTKVVRFDLDGLGDPFYRLLGHSINTEYADSRNLTRALEQGGEEVDALCAMLDEAWASYELNGGLLIYPWNVDTFDSVKHPSPSTIVEEKEEEDEESDDDEKKSKKKEPPPPKPAFKVVRAIDLLLVINVLARARSQLLLARAPLILSQQYLNRALVTDDPRLIALAEATGCFEEG